MSGLEPEMPDPVIDEVRKMRARLVQEHGGLGEYVAHLQEQQRKRERDTRPRPEARDS